jgi:hypothetical protein
LSSRSQREPVQRITTTRPSRHEYSIGTARGPVSASSVRSGPPALERSEFQRSFLRQAANARTPSSRLPLSPSLRTRTFNGVKFGFDMKARPPPAHLRCEVRHWSHAHLCQMRRTERLGIRCHALPSLIVLTFDIGRRSDPPYSLRLLLYSQSSSTTSSSTASSCGEDQASSGTCANRGRRNEPDRAVSQFRVRVQDEATRAIGTKNSMLHTGSSCPRAKREKKKQMTSLGLEPRIS